MTAGGQVQNAQASVSEQNSVQLLCWAAFAPAVRLSCAWISLHKAAIIGSTVRDECCHPLQQFRTNGLAIARVDSDDTAHQAIPRLALQAHTEPPVVLSHEDRFTAPSA